MYRVCNYLYNGIELPALPEWDKETYPYAVISKIGTTSYKYSLRLFKKPYTISSSKPSVYSFFNADIGDVFLTANCPYDNPVEWGELSQMEIVESYVDANDVTIVVTGVSLVWSNYDIMGGGKLVLAASEPIPVTSAPAPDPTSMLMGWLVGRAIAGQRGKKAEPSEPIAYLYNGVQLPKLLEWDKETYPYATIQMFAGGAWYILRASTSTASHDGTNTVITAPFILSNYYPGEMEWRSFSNMEADVNAVSVIWANHDIYNGETLYLSASEPVPVYA